MHLVFWITVLKTLNFTLLLQACPFSPQLSSHVGMPHLKSQVTKYFPGARKSDQILSFLLILHILIGTLGSVSNQNCIEIIQFLMLINPMHLVVLNNCLKNLKFQYTFASLPIQPTVIFPYRDVTFKKSSDQKLPRGQKKRPDFKLFTDSAHPDRDTGEWHIDGGALSGYSEVLGKRRTERIKKGGEKKGKN